MKVVYLSISIAAALAGAWYAFRDEPPPADAHLRSYRRSVKEEENGFRLVNLTAEDVWRSEEEPLPEPFSPDFDRALAGEAVEKNAAVLDTVDRCLALPEFQVETTPRLGAPMPHIGAWRDLGDLLGVRARLHLESKRASAAFEDAVRLVRFGRRIRGSQGCLLEYVVGARIEASGLESLVYTAIRGTVPPENMRRAIELLSEDPPSATWLQDALRAEYVTFSKTLDALAAGERVDSDLQRGLAYWRFRRPFLKPNQTRRLLCERIGFLVAQTARAAEERVALEPVAMPGESWLGRLTGGGAFLAGFLLIACEGSLEHRDLGLFQTRATAAVLALLLSRAETGSMAGSLDELVPRYLSSIPIDPFDGKPLRYSASARILYSVGIDGFDDGGSEQEDPMQAFKDKEEPTLSFSTEAWDLGAMEESRQEREREELKRQVEAGGAVWKEK